MCSGGSKPLLPTKPDRTAETDTLGALYMLSINNSFNFFWIERFTYEKGGLICKNSDVYTFQDYFKFIFLVLLCACIHIA